MKVKKENPDALRMAISQLEKDKESLVKHFHRSKRQKKTINLTLHEASQLQEVDLCVLEFEELGVRAEIDKTDSTQVYVYVTDDVKVLIQGTEISFRASQYLTDKLNK